MKNTILRIVILAFCAAVALVAFNLNKGVESEIVGSMTNQQTYVMGVSADYPPFEYMQAGQIVGFDIDLARELAKELGFNLKIEEMDFSNLIPALQTGRIDFAISSMVPTLARSHNVSFSDVYYSNIYAMLMQKHVDVDMVMAYKDKKIAAQIGSSMQQYLQDKQKEVPTLEIIALAKTPQMVEELRLGRIDGILLDDRVATELMNKNADFKIAKIADFNGDNAIAFKKDSPLVAQFNIALAKLKTNGKLNELEKTWLPAAEAPQDKQ